MSLLKRFDAALESRKNGNYQSALGTLAELEQLSQNPEDIAKLRFAQLTCLVDLGRVEEANAIILTIDKEKLNSADQVDFQFESARLARANGDLNAALDYIRSGRIYEATFTDKSSVRTLMRNINTLQGIVLCELGNCQEAMPLLETVPTDDEGWAEAQLCLGDCKYREGAYNLALQYYFKVNREGSRVDPAFQHSAVRNIGFAYYQLGDYKASVKYLSKVVDVFDHFPTIQNEVQHVLSLASSKLKTYADDKSGSIQ